MTPADICRAHGWGAGTLLQWLNLEVYRLTAVGDECVLARIALFNPGDGWRAPEYMPEQLLRVTSGFVVFAPLCTTL